MTSHYRTKNLHRGSWEEVFYDVYSGVSVGASHSIWTVKDWTIRNIFRPVKLVMGLDKSGDHGIMGRGKNLDGGDRPTLKVVGVGYGRTGTYSLTMALEELGFPTLHTQHMYETHDILDMWTEAVFLPSLRAQKVTMGEPDFDMIASYGFQATADLPMALYFEEISSYYPDCKFILTTREDSEIWFRSWDIMTRGISQPAQYGTFIPHVRKLGYYMRWLFSIVNQDDSFLSVPFPLPGQNKEMSIRSYEEHNRRVREVIPPSRLLEYNVKDGYKPLCTFLNITECPTQPFPKSNSARAVKVQTISAFVVPLTATVLIIFTLFSVIFQKLTGKTVSKWIQSNRQPFLDVLSRKEGKRQMKKRLKCDSNIRMTLPLPKRD